MKPFDLDAARRGAAVCTTDGRSVTLVGFSFETKTICGYVAPDCHDLWALNGAHAFEATRCLMMRDDGYEDRLALGDYKVPDDGFIREPAPEQKHDDQEYPKAEMGFTEVPPAFDGAAIASILSRLFGTPAPATRLRINIEYEGAPMTFDPSKVSEALADLYKESGVLAESAPESKQEVS